MKAPPGQVITGQIPLLNEDRTENVAPPYSIQTAVAQQLHQRSELPEETARYWNK